MYIFVYCEDDDLNERRVIGTLYTAEKYSITGLVYVCRSFLESNMNKDTVCIIMENARLFNLQGVLSNCLTFILQSELISRKIFESKGIIDLSRDSLVLLLTSDDLMLPEEYIYKSLIRWAKHICETKGDDKTSNKILRVLGNMLFHIIFPLIPLETFWKDVGVDEVLSAKEKTQISKLIVGKHIVHTSFVSRQRRSAASKNPEEVKICSMGKGIRKCHFNEEVDAVNLIVDKLAQLQGIVLWGCDKVSGIVYSYQVEVKMLSSTKVVVVHFPETSISCTRKQINITFPNVCWIFPYQTYTVWVKMTGPFSNGGCYFSTVDCKGYTFTISKSNETDERKG